ncbi:MAG: hypothetical protein U0840_19890 [Gemmataceae bacterium]
MTSFVLLSLLTLPAGTPSDSAPGAVRFSIAVPGCKTSSAAKMPYQPQPGDIILFRSSNFVSNVLCNVVLCGGATHSAMIVPCKDGTLALLETPKVGSAVSLSDIETQLQKYKGKIWVRRRCKPLTPEQSQNLTSFACSQAGKSYDFVGLLVMPACRPMQLISKTTPHADDVDENRWFCSSLVVAACVAANLIDPREARPCCICPNDLMNDKLIDLSCGWDKPTTLFIDSCDCKASAD